MRNDRKPLKNEKLRQAFYSFLLVLILPLSVNAQSKESPDSADSSVKPIEFTRIVYASDSLIAADILFDKCIAWCGAYYKSAKTVFDIQNKSSGLIILKAVRSFDWPGPISTFTSNIDYTVNISVKQGKVRIIESYYSLWDNYRHSPFTDSPEPSYKGVGRGQAKKEWRAAHEAVNSSHKEIVSTLEAAINKKDNW